MRLLRQHWLDHARKLDWSYSSVEERSVFPEAISGRPWLELASGRTLDERILARNLRKHGITARTLRSQGKVGRGYLAADFGLRDGPA